jgi:hypothetical protein
MRHPLELLHAKTFSGACRITRTFIVQANVQSFQSLSSRT